jgi:peroxiredoxin
MSDAAPPGPTGPSASEKTPEEPAAAAVRKPRKIFLLIGVVAAVGLGIGLFTGIGTSQRTTGAPYEGGPVPSFSGSNVGPRGQTKVDVSAGDAGGAPTVLLFFGAWCPSCHQELPTLTKVIREQQRTQGRLDQVRVIGVDSEDTVSNAKAFIASSGVTFPVAYDPNLSITEGAFYFDGDPNAVFVKANGTIAKIVRGDTLTAASFRADEASLIRNGT